MQSIYPAFSEAKQEQRAILGNLGQTGMDLASLPRWASIETEHFPIVDFHINTFPNFPKGKVSNEVLFTGRTQNVGLLY